jgi:hypothetical protein
MLALLVLLTCGAGKPTVSLEESCRKAQLIVVVEPAAEAAILRVLDVLYDGTGQGPKEDAEIAVDLKGLRYDRGGKYILFLEQVGDAKHYQAVPQMRSEDAKPMRERVRELLRAIGKIK